MSPENIAENTKIVQDIEMLAKEKGVSLSQLSLSWVMNQGNDVFPIPGTTKIPHVEQNIAASDVNLTKEELKKIGDAASKIKGDRLSEDSTTGSFKSHE